jgi:hypothetical protein
LRRAENLELIVFTFYEFLYDIAVTFARSTPANQNHIAFLIQLFEPFKFCLDFGTILYGCFQKISIFPYDFFSVTVSSDDKGIAERARPAYVDPGAIVISFIDNSYAYGKNLPCVKRHLRRADILQLCHRRRAIQSALSRQNRHQRGLKGKKA